jgi:hypothetical protein
MEKAAASKKIVSYLIATILNTPRVYPLLISIFFFQKHNALEGNTKLSMSLVLL